MLELEQFLVDEKLTLTRWFNAMDASFRSAHRDDSDSEDEEDAEWYPGGIKPPKIDPHATDPTGTISALELKKVRTPLYPTARARRAQKRARAAQRPSSFARAERAREQREQSPPLRLFRSCVLWLQLLFCGRSGQNLGLSGGDPPPARKVFAHSPQTRARLGWAAEAGRISGCRGENPRIPPAAGEVALVPERLGWGCRPPHP
jgi:hypothetical protein